MDYTTIFHAGMTEEDTIPVTDADTAIQIGSGALRVLATPRLIAFMERCSHRLLARYLPAGLTTVGAFVEVRHLAPTPVGSTIRVRCEIIQLNGRLILFDVQAWDPQEQVGSGQHQRVIVDEARFLQRVASKIST
jgi:fluoroacetyl-CoA thioesterase